MKIVVTGTRGIPGIMGGVETHCEELFPRIARKGFDVTVIRRKSYVHDTLRQYEGITLVDLATPKRSRSKRSSIRSGQSSKPKS